MDRCFAEELTVAAGLVADLAGVRAVLVSAFSPAMIGILSQERIYLILKPMDDGQDTLECTQVSATSNTPMAKISVNNDMMQPNTICLNMRKCKLRIKMAKMSRIRNEEEMIWWPRRRGKLVDKIN